MGSTTVFLHSCRFRSCPGGNSNERGRPASTVQSTAIVAPDHRLLHEKHGLLSGRTIAIEGGQHWRKTVVELCCTVPLGFQWFLATISVVIRVAGSPDFEGAGACCASERPFSAQRRIPIANPGVRRQGLQPVDYELVCILLATG